MMGPVAAGPITTVLQYSALAGGALRAAEDPLVAQVHYLPLPGPQNATTARRSRGLQDASAPGSPNSTAIASRPEAQLDALATTNP